MNSSASTQQFFTVNEIAIRYALHAKTVYVMIERGDLPSIKINAKSKRPVIRVSAAALEEWERTQLSRGAK
jgi:hypothetical protein